MLPPLNSWKVQLLDDRRLLSQLHGLERRTARGGRDSIDHGTGTHDDVANSVAGALVLASGRVPFVIFGYCFTVGAATGAGNATRISVI
jgi:hypothetical protein